MCGESRRALYFNKNMSDSPFPFIADITIMTEYKRVHFFPGQLSEYYPANWACAVY